VQNSLSWESTFEIVIALKKRYPTVQIADLSLNDIFAMTIDLPEFEDDPNLANERILEDIYIEWIEESL